ncbi:MAG: glycine cleavage system protein H [Lachnospiraceae bacterium]|nr:glycine cleavage system protein H [Lachnospiraceae bacterium]
MEERLYTKEHIWILPQAEKVLIGITDYAQGKLGNVVFVNLPDLGDEMEKGEAFGDIESVKTVSDLIAPFSGKITDVNEAVIDSPELINEDAAEAWLIAADIPTRYEDVMTESEYKDYLQQL